MPSKYKNRKTQIGDLTFHSAKEAKRYLDLMLLQKAGRIKDLELQPRLKIVVNAMIVCTYVGDFKYKELVKNQWIERIEDCKGFQTPMYKLKRKLVKAVHGMDLVET